MDTIFLQDMKVETVIGIWEWERKIRQTVAIDLEMSADIRKAAASDSVEDTLNYKSVAKRVQAFPVPGRGGSVGPDHPATV